MGAPVTSMAGHEVQSGGPGQAHAAPAAGFFAIPLDRVAVGALAGIAVYILPDAGIASAPNPQAFRLYSRDGRHFSARQRERLYESGVNFIYIRVEDHHRFCRQTQEMLLTTADDASLPPAERATIVYESGVDMMNQVLSDPQAPEARGFQQVSRAITSLVHSEPAVLGCLFDASHHDFYTATHVMNVGMWMALLASELGYSDPEMLDTICQAGLLHDIGMMTIPADVINHKGPLSEQGWSMVRRHPELGYQLLKQYDVDPLVRRVAMEHHERLDGTGYPRGRRGDEIHVVSRICALVDSFDGMTAFRPFKERTATVDEAMTTLARETPRCYDQEILAAWTRVLERSNLYDPAHAAAGEEGPCQRRHPRSTFHCRARLHELSRRAERVIEGEELQVFAHSVSRSGLGLLVPRPMVNGIPVRIYLEASGWEQRALDGRTVRCRSYDDGWHEVGVAFESAAQAA
jgi:putative nucleotidyltransferase with HDIG domain